MSIKIYFKKYFIIWYLRNNNIKNNKNILKQYLYLSFKTIFFSYSSPLIFNFYEVKILLKP